MILERNRILVPELLDEVRGKMKQRMCNVQKMSLKNLSLTTN
jgi:hypothetical protein